MKATQTPTSSSSSSSSVKSNPTPTSMKEEEERNNDVAQSPTDTHNYFPGCRRDANCGCSICLESIKSMLDLMPMSAQRTSLSKFSASRPLIVVEKTPISIDSTLLSTPTSMTRPDPNPILVLTPTPLRSTAKSVHPKPISIPRRTTSFRDFSRRIIGRTLMCLFLFLAVEFGGSWLALMVLGTPRVSSIMVEKLIEESLGVDDLGEKIRVMEKGLERFGLGREISSCGTKNSTWKIDQDGLLLDSRCTFHKSTAEEVTIWGWPFHNSGLLTTGSSSRWMAVISGGIIEWENGGIGSQVARNAGSTWVLKKWSSSAVQFEPNTWVLEYRRNSLLENPRFFSAVGDFLKYVVSVFIRRARKEFWFINFDPTQAFKPSSFSIRLPAGVGLLRRHRSQLVSAVVCLFVVVSGG
ncbi:hypothetical protein V2J09_006090 [Rumex salicifolius]